MAATTHIWGRGAADKKMLEAMRVAAVLGPCCSGSLGSTTCLKRLLQKMTPSSVVTVRVYEICCWALGFVGARVRWEDVHLVVTSLMACWGARCYLQAHIRYLVKLVARVLECLLFANSCQLSCQVCSPFGSPATPRGKVVGTILRQRSCRRSLKSSNFSLAFYNIAEGGGGEPSKKPWFSL